MGENMLLAFNFLDYAPHFSFICVRVDSRNELCPDFSSGLSVCSSCLRFDFLKISEAFHRWKIPKRFPRFVLNYSSFLTGIVRPCTSPFRTHSARLNNTLRCGIRNKSCDSIIYGQSRHLSSCQVGKSLALFPIS